MNKRNNEAIKIAEEIITNIEVEPFTITNVRKFYRLVCILKIENEIKWVERELYGYKNLNGFPYYRKIKDSQSNNKFAFIRDSYAMLRAYAENGDILNFNLLLNDGHYTYNEIRVGPNNFYFILNFVDNEIYRKTSRILSKLKFEKIESDIFEETRKSVNEELNALCPNAFEKLTEIYEDMIESKSKLDLQQVAHGCRVVLKDFADSVFPPTDKKIKGFDGIEHGLKDNNYINRIVAFVQESIDSKSNKNFMSSHLAYLASFLDNIDDLANTGTHTEISQEQANRCLIYTYLVLGDIINLSVLNSKKNQ